MKLLIWGIGQLSWQAVKDISEDEIIGYIDTYSGRETFAGKPLYRPAAVNELEYDAILVSTIFGGEVAQTCKQYGIPLEKVVFVYGNMQMVDRNRDYGFVAKICGEKIAAAIKNRYHLIREIAAGVNSEKKSFEVNDFSNEKAYKNDYIRVKTFELLVDEIKRAHIGGQIAELGVFRGDFALFLNAAFPDRKLYLFDTFDGFDEEELNRELQGDAMLAIRDTYKNTSVQIVADKMRHKDNIIIKQGFFPGSAGGWRKLLRLCH